MFIGVITAQSAWWSEYEEKLVFDMTVQVVRRQQENNEDTFGRYNDLMESVFIRAIERLPESLVLREFFMPVRTVQVVEPGQYQAGMTFTFELSHVDQPELPRSELEAYCQNLVNYVQDGLNKFERGSPLLLVSVYILICGERGRVDIRQLGGAFTQSRQIKSRNFPVDLEPPNR